MLVMLRQPIMIAYYVIALMVLIHGSEEDESNCEEDEGCDEQQDSILADFASIMKRAEPVDMYLDNGPCHYCLLSQIHTLKRDRPMCSAVMLENGIHHQTIPIKLDNIHADCNCTFKNDKQEDLIANMIIDWKNPQLDITTNINDEGRSSDVTGIIVCDNKHRDTLNLCKISKDNLHFTCKSSNKQAQKVCESDTHKLAPEILEIIASHGIPKTLEKNINTNVALFQRIQCQAGLG